MSSNPEAAYSYFLEARAKRTRDRSWFAFHNKLRRHEIRVAAIFRRYFKRERERVLAVLSETPLASARIGLEADKFDRAWKRINAKLKDDQSQLLAEFREPLEAAFRAAGTTIAMSTAVNVGFKWPGFPKETASWIRSYIPTLADTINATTVHRIEAKVREGFEKGWDNKQLADEIRGLYDGWDRSRPQTIAQTETGKVASKTEQDVLSRSPFPDEVITATWLTARDNRVRDSHQELEGESVTKGEPFSNGLAYPREEDGPPEEVINCFLPGTRVSGRFVAGSKTRYSGPVREIETVRGHRLSITANHPVLTDQGWVKAHQLRKGDHLFSYRIDRHGLSFSDKDDQDRVPLVEHVFESLRMNGRSRFSPVSRLDFYGDGFWMQGDVEIVDAARLLLFRRESRAGQEKSQLRFVISDPAKIAAHVPSASKFGCNRVALAAPRQPCSLRLAQNQLAILFDTRPLQQFCFGPAAYWNVVSAKKSGDAIMRDSTLGTELLRAHPREIGMDQIIRIRDFKFSGHVYDLQTDVGYILSQNIISSNCRCACLYEVDRSKWAEYQRE